MKRIPFYKNLEDNTHCFQASLKMVIEFFSGDVLSFDELDKITLKIKDKPTWEIAGLLYLVDNNYEVINFNQFNYHEFAEKGAEYIKMNYPQEVYEYQVKNSDITKEQKLATDLVMNKKIEFRPTKDINNFRQYLNNGFLIIAHVNSNSLNNKEGYEGHFTVVYKMDDDSVYFNDPGLPARENRVETIQDFGNAWDQVGEAYAIRLKNEE
jgi:hypothetical protein